MENLVTTYTSYSNSSLNEREMLDLDNISYNEDFKNKFVNTKKKNKFKLIYTEKKYINETLFQTIIRTLSGRKIEQDEIKTSINIELTENSDFDYEQ